MANPDHLRQLREGARAFNAWRNQHPEIVPDLAGVELTLGQRQLGPSNGGPVNLRAANLEGAMLRHATLVDADLEGACLRGADLGRARLNGARLTNADLSGAVLDQADFHSVQLDGAVLAGASLAGAGNLTQSQLNSTQGDLETILPTGFIRPKSWWATPAESWPTPETKAMQDAAVVPEPEVAIKATDVPGQAAEAAIKVADVPGQTAEAAIKVADVPGQAAEAAIKVANVPRQAAEAAIKVADVSGRAAEAASKITDVPRQTAETMFRSPGALTKASKLAEKAPQPAMATPAPTMPAKLKMKAPAGAIEAGRAGNSVTPAAEILKPAVIVARGAPEPVIEKPKPAAKQPEAVPAVPSPKSPAQVPKSTALVPLSKARKPEGEVEPKIEERESDDPFAHLGLDSSANLEEIRAAYRRLLELYHPDVDPSEEAERRLERATEAYRKLLAPGAELAQRQRRPFYRLWRAAMIILLLLLLGTGAVLYWLMLVSSNIAIGPSGPEPASAVSAPAPDNPTTDAASSETHAPAEPLEEKSVQPATEGSAPPAAPDATSPATPAMPGTTSDVLPEAAAPPQQSAAPEAVLLEVLSGGAGQERERQDGMRSVSAAATASHLDRQLSIQGYPYATALSDFGWNSAWIS